MNIRKLLIANRGEIACRVIKTARQMGIATVAVYSAADANARHVRMADEAISIGAAPARDSYLVVEKIIAAALQTGAQAIHPGYGFLSENAGFAQACADSGLVFIGPPVPAIVAMGGKSAAKALMAEAGVPLTPGYHGDNQDPDFLFGEAEKIGWPVLIKASAGGGGKGMRLVEKSEDFLPMLASCQREATASFGDATVLVEKYVTKPRHIEVQVFGDSHGNVVYLYERDCSVQRRHQKVLEEAPAPGMTPERRAEMGEAAVRAAAAVKYEGAGTVEFIANQDGSFYFMEMNTRLQVEHPVTEMITGLDLVEWQIRVAAGERLPLTQEQIRLDGHSLEARIYAEDPARKFMPSTGRLEWLSTPAASDTVRIDTGVEAGDVISPHYDPMIAKLIVHAPDRAGALSKMQNALARYQVLGVANNVPFLSRLIATESFSRPDLDTGLIERESAALFSPPPELTNEIYCFAALACVLTEQASRLEAADAGAQGNSPWDTLQSWRLNLPARWRLRFDGAEQIQAVSVQVLDDGFECRVNGQTLSVAGRLLDNHRLRATVDGRLTELAVVQQGNLMHLFVGTERYRIERHDPIAQAEQSDHGGGGLTAPMPGKIVAVKTSPGAVVRKGDALLIMEAMKMEHTIAAPVDGTVKSIHFEAGDQVTDGAELVSFEVSE
ncbi:MAG: acetyl/propionyl/methylcrotonyl-CoA carboxylase subunit alpha [Burkholderiaceae bacterium]